MDARIGNMEKDLSQVKTDVAKLLELAAQQKGGKATVAAWGSGGVGIGGLIVAAAQWLGMGGHPAQAAPAQQPPAIVQPAPRVADPAVNPTTGP